MAITGVLRPGHVAIRVLEMEPALKHYTEVLGLIEVAVIWTIIARYLPVADMGTLIQNMLQHKPLLVTE